MRTSRRGFLGMLASAIAGTALIDPAEALWTPGKRLISIPQSFYSPSTNVLLTPQMITNDILEIFMKNLAFVKHEYEKRLGIPKIGDTLNLRIPRSFRARS